VAPQFPYIAAPADGWEIEAKPGQIIGGIIGLRRRLAI
jgi:hypothetical protein